MSNSSTLQVKRAFSIDGEASNPSTKRPHVYLHPLAYLPYELWEEASYYLTRKQAVDVLAVHRDLHDAFAHRIWHTIELNRWNVDRVSLDAWNRYRGLVRRAKISVNAPSKTILSFSGLLQLEIMVTTDNSVVFDTDMPRLQNLTIWHPAASPPELYMAGLYRAAAWVSIAHKREQNVWVMWIVTVDGDDAINWMGHLLDNATGRCDLIVCKVALSNGILANKHSYQVLTKLEPYLINLTFKSDYFEFEVVEFNSVFTNGNIVFSRLKELKLDLVANISGMDAPSLTGYSFPALDSVTLRYVSVYMLVTGTWLNLTKLYLILCKDIVLCPIVGFFPVLEYLSFGECDLIFDPQEMATRLPRLQHLAVDDGCNVEFKRSVNCIPYKASFTHLRKFEYAMSEMTDYELKAEIFQFIMYCAPQLESVMFGSCCFTASTLDEFQGVTNDCLRHISIVFFEGSIAEEDFCALIALFPKLETLNLSSDVPNKELLSAIGRRYPHVNISMNSNHRDVGWLLYEAF
ncbi:hypothetical protein GQ42DRAFT_68482 [Ramicandelaber brevisporus]|nr:hypothetical protein GQ42DRAFT_68482 [Ramicandelaber brevisporus]